MRGTGGLRAARFHWWAGGRRAHASRERRDCTAPPTCAARTACA
ncbi:hypothetical protein MYA_4178 [Burkholderia sp. KJ006]|nr:hypothetical protein MYA_4178 [Burkholderia sp. KJ006]